MPANEDLLFGKIAVSRGFCKQEQIDECVQIQALDSSPPALGDILLFKNYITSEQHREVIKLQLERMQAEDPLGKLPKESILFGKLAVREKLMTQEQANQCLREQGRPGETRSIGEIMIAKGYLDADQVKDLLSRQLKRILWCPVCKLSFTVFSISGGKKVDCPKCKGLLQEGKPGGSTGTDAEFATQVVRAVKVGVPPSVRDSTRVVPVTAKPVKATCVICDTAFEAPLDTTGRLRCPSCNSTFTPK